MNFHIFINEFSRKFANGDCVKYINLDNTNLNIYEVLELI